VASRLLGSTGLHGSVCVTAAGAARVSATKLSFSQSNPAFCCRLFRSPRRRVDLAFGALSSARARGPNRESFTTSARLVPAARQIRRSTVARCQQSINRIAECLLFSLDALTVHPPVSRRTGAFLYSAGGDGGELAASGSFPSSFEIYASSLSSRHWQCVLLGRQYIFQSSSSAAAEGRGLKFDDFCGNLAAVS
jgi:hypothetical protein